MYKLQADSGCNLALVRCCIRIHTASYLYPCHVYADKRVDSINQLFSCNFSIRENT